MSGRGWGVIRNRERTTHLPHGAGRHHRARHAGSATCADWTSGQVGHADRVTDLIGKVDGALDVVGAAPAADAAGQVLDIAGRVADAFHISLLAAARGERIADATLLAAIISETASFAEVAERKTLV